MYGLLIIIYDRELELLVYFLNRHREFESGFLSGFLDLFQHVQ